MHLLNRALALAAFACAGLFALPASAATLCVNTSGSFPCFMHIGDAVNAANVGDVIQVSGGTYHEGVTITKPVSIIGQAAILDASGFGRGFFVNGLAAPGLVGVNISGFTIQNANFEGVLFLNVAGVSLSNSTVMNNDLALVHGNPATCPGLDGFETNESNDCGEGIHLMAVDHSIITNNVAQGNSGGILISDDTGATHDNLISFNTVLNNPYACGLTLASHPPATIGGVVSTTGVYHNTVYGNRATKNGVAIGGGSGVGLFASAPGTQTYGNVVVDNYVAENGLPGIAMHAHAPNQKLSDNMIVGNTVVNNAADTEDAATPGTTGINIYSLGPAPGNIIANNMISSEQNGVAANLPSPVQVEFNSFSTPTGVVNVGSNVVYAVQNWWGCTTGSAMGGGCAATSGPTVAAIPWLSTPTPGQPNY